MFVLYGAQSPGNSFLHPRDMDPTGRTRGSPGVVADVAVGHAGRRLADVHRRGQLLRAEHAGQQQRCRPPAASAEVTDRRSTRAAACRCSAASPRRIRCGTAPTACSARYRPCEVTSTPGNGVVVPCATLHGRRDRRAVAGRHDAHAPVQRAADTLQDNVPAVVRRSTCSTRGPQTWLIVAAPPPGFMYTDPVALQARAEPQVIAADRGRCHAGRRRHGADRSAQRLRHRRPEPHGRAMLAPPPTCRAGCNAASRRPRRRPMPTETRAPGRRPACA